MVEKKNVEWAIGGIKELEFMVNEFVQLDPTVDTNYTVDLVPVVEKEMILFTITANYLNGISKELVMKGKVMTVYLIKDMKLVTKKNRDNKDIVDLPDKLWISLFSMAFTHARALIAKSSAGTKYAHMLLPIINPEKEFHKLFGPYLQEMNFPLTEK